MNHVSHISAGISRRDALRLGLLGAGGLAFTGVLSGCSNDASRSSSNAPGSVSATPSASDALPAFRWDQMASETPDLPRRIAWANTSNAEFFLAFTRGMEAAAEERDIEFLTAIADDNPEKNVQQIQTFLSRGVGALMYQPLDLAAQRPLIEQALEDGIFVPGLITFPTTLQIAASQYTVGFTQGKAAADYAVAELGGNAEVAYFNLDDLSPQLVLRHDGVLAGLKTGGPGIKVVSDLTTGISTDEGFNVMSTVLQAHPNVKIVMGGDTLVVGALRALEQAGKATDDLYLSGVDGDALALEAVRQGGPYKASIAFAWQLMGYGIGQFSIDWIEGKQVPRVMVAAPLLLDTPELVDEYQQANAEPAAVFTDRARYEEYLPLLGNTSYDDRKTFWTEEYVPG